VRRTLHEHEQTLHEHCTAPLRDTTKPSTSYYTAQFTWGYTAWNSTTNVNPKCLAHYGETDAWMCFHGAIAAAFLDTPMLVVNSKFDTWQERGVLGLNTTECTHVVDQSTGVVTYCDKSMSAAAVEEDAFWRGYAASMAAAAGALPSHHGAFLTNCPMHCTSGGDNYPAAPGVFLGKAIQAWWTSAIVNVGNASWVAPRWVASATDGCLVQQQ
jgi:hypothetical protein